MTTVRTDPYGTLSDGTAVTIATLSAGCGVRLSVISYGGIITALETPDREGRTGNIVLGFANLADYETHNGDCHFGALIGRYANRIARGHFTLDGRPFQLPLNDGPNTLHGGPDGFGRRVWDLEVLGDDAVRLSLDSPDGDAGFPGTLRAAVVYRLADDGSLAIEYQATTDQPTVVNLTNHSYFNLAGNGGGTIGDHVAQIEADHYTPVDETLIPTGEVSLVEGTALDFRTATLIGTRLREASLALTRGYDHNWVVRPAPPGELALAAIIRDPASGRTLTCRTTQPGLQFYTGNFLDGTKVGSAGTLYRQTDGFALETQHFPDSPNQPGFPSTVLRPGETYRHRTVFSFATD